MTQLALVNNKKDDTKLLEMQDNIRKYCIPEKASVTQAEIEQFAQICISRNLNPLAKHIYFTPIWDKAKGKTTAVPVISIDGMRALAEETGTYAGQTLPLFCGKDGVWKELWISNEPPFACKIGIYRKDFPHPTFVIAKWDSYVKKNKDGSPSQFWLQYPEQMLAKCTESLGLRKTCPEKLSGLYSKDEMDNVIDVEKIPELKNEEKKQEETKQIQAPISGSQHKRNEDTAKIFDINNQFNEKKAFFMEQIEKNIAIFCVDGGIDVSQFKHEILNGFKDRYLKANGNIDFDDYFQEMFLIKKINYLVDEFAKQEQFSHQEIKDLKSKIWNKCKTNPEAKVEDVFTAMSALLKV